MPITKIYNSNILTYPLDIRINTVNCVGVMGKGLALQFKQQYPAMFKKYKSMCRTNDLLPGEIFVWENGRDHIINVATKLHWKNPSKYQYINNGITNIKNYLLQQKKRKIVGIPPIGCGCGGLDWEIVKDLIVDNLKDLHHTIYIFEPT